MISGYHNQIRHMSEDEADFAILTNLPFIVESYGGYKDIPAKILDEAIELIISKFSFISIDEIKEAYRQWSTGEITTNGRAEMFGGQFNVAQLGKILGAYTQKRRKVIAEFINKRDSAKEAAKEAARIERSKKDFLENFQQRLTKAAMDFESWHQVPIGWYEECTRRGLFQWENEARQKKGILARAQTFSLMIAKKDNANKTRFAQNNWEIVEATAHKNATDIAKKISVFENILNNPQNILAS